MERAAHFINRREGVNLIGLEHIENHEHSTCCWAISASDAAELVGGWIYLHSAKGEKSRLGGVVREVALVESDADDTSRYKILFEVREGGRGQAWRGADHAMAWWSGLVDASAPHEGEADA